MKKFDLPPQKERSFAYVAPNNSNCVKLYGGVVTYDLNKLILGLLGNPNLDNKRLVSEVWSEQKETKRAKLN